MRAFVDPDLCIGCTQCAGICPAVFTMEGTLLPKSPGSNCLPVIFFGRVLCYTIRCENSEWRIRNDAFTGH